MTLAISVGILVAGGVFLILQRGLVRVVLGFMLLSHAVNLLLISAGVTANRAIPFLGTSDADAAADPLPQAFVLTAIVISFAITVYMLTLAAADKDDDTEDDDIEDDS
ncbi:sodium:proton antiporter [Georgenia satyanarayanai]|uniref:sodium:proton antiporter n=1 Tax=Georgenia satyanarayanai TaxID=860221 RepID=UPI0012648D38|nr:cation:proton antiporter subunit C [Georgenia satyanarayanai]